MVEDRSISWPFTISSGFSGRPPELMLTKAFAAMRRAVELADGGEESMCGWLRDRFGVSWQVIPSALPKFLTSLEPGKAQKAGEAMMKMKKIVIADLEAAVR